MDSNAHFFNNFPFSSLLPEKSCPFLAGQKPDDLKGQALRSGAMSGAQAGRLPGLLLVIIGNDNK